MHLRKLVNSNISIYDLCITYHPDTSVLVLVVFGLSWSWSVKCEVKIKFKNYKLNVGGGYAICDV